MFGFRLPLQIYSNVFNLCVCVYFKHIKSSLDLSISVRYNFSHYVCFFASNFILFFFCFYLFYNSRITFTMCAFVQLYHTIAWEFLPKFMNYSIIIIRIVGTFAFHHLHLIITIEYFGLRSTIYLLHLSSSLSGALLFAVCLK